MLEEAIELRAKSSAHKIARHLACDEPKSHISPFWSTFSFNDKVKCTPCLVHLSIEQFLFVDSILN